MCPCFFILEASFWMTTVSTGEAFETSKISFSFSKSIKLECSVPDASSISLFSCGSAGSNTGMQAGEFHTSPINWHISNGISNKRSKDEHHFFFLLPTLPREIVTPSDLGEKVRGGQYHVRQKGGTISRTVGGWPFWCEEGRAKVVPATPLKLSPPALKLSVGAKYRFLGGTISRGRVGT